MAERQNKVAAKALKSAYAGLRRSHLTLMNSTPPTSNLEHVQRKSWVTAQGFVKDIYLRCMDLTNCKSSNHVGGNSQQFQYILTKNVLWAMNWWKKQSSRTFIRSNILSGHFCFVFFLWEWWKLLPQSKNNEHIEKWIQSACNNV